MDEGYVCCDICSKVYDDGDQTSGGFLLLSKGVGPCCEMRMRQGLRESGELDAIGAECPLYMSFRDWIIGIR